MVELSAAVIKLQQQLSEKFGIPTFTTTGEISTVPTTRSLSNIDVGTGIFQAETTESFTSKLRQNISALRQRGGQIGSTPIPITPTKSTDPQKTNADEPSDFTDFGQTFNEGLGSAGEFLRKNPTILIIGAGLLAFTVLKR